MHQSATIRTHISVRLILLSVFAAHLLYPLTFNWRINKNKEIQSAIISSEAKERYITLTLSHSTYAKALRDEGKELKLNDRMYDIVSVELTKDNAVCTVLVDDHETEIDNELSSDIKKDAAGKTAKRLANWQPVFYVQTDVTRLLFTDITNISYPSTGVSSLPVGYLHTIKKPPRTV